MRQLEEIVTNALNLIKIRKRNQIHFRESVPLLVSRYRAFRQFQLRHSHIKRIEMVSMPQQWHKVMFTPIGPWSHCYHLVLSKIPQGVITTFRTTVLLLLFDIAKVECHSATYLRNRNYFVYLGQNHREFPFITCTYINKILYICVEL